MKTEEKTYITTRLVKQKATEAFKRGAEVAMETNGFVIVAHEGWIVKKSDSGLIERIEEIEVLPNSLKLVLD
jgi:hypothetical protein